MRLVLYSICGSCARRHCDILIKHKILFLLKELGFMLQLIIVHIMYSAWALLALTIP